MNGREAKRAMTEATLQQIQGRLNQREVPWVATQVSRDDPAVTFNPVGRSEVRDGVCRRQLPARIP
jgi:hypothetical protein